MIKDLRYPILVQFWRRRSVQMNVRRYCESPSAPSGGPLREFAKIFSRTAFSMPDPAILCFRYSKAAMSSRRTQKRQWCTTRDYALSKVLDRCVGEYG